jgi:hypothetical protein
MAVSKGTQEAIDKVKSELKEEILEYKADIEALKGRVEVEADKKYRFFGFKAKAWAWVILVGVAGAVIAAFLV